MDNRNCVEPENLDIHLIPVHEAIRIHKQPLETMEDKFEIQGCPDFRLDWKLKMFKIKLKEWSRNNFRELIYKK